MLFPSNIIRAFNWRNALLLTLAAGQLDGASVAGEGSDDESAFFCNSVPFETPPNIGKIESGILLEETIWISALTAGDSNSQERKLYELKQDGIWKEFPIPRIPGEGAIKMVSGESGFLIFREEDPRYMTWIFLDQSGLRALPLPPLSEGEIPVRVMISSDRVYLVATNEAHQFSLYSTLISEGSSPEDWTSLGLIPLNLSEVLDLTRQWSGFRDRIYLVVRKAPAKDNDPSRLFLISMDSIDETWKEEGSILSDEKEFRIFPFGIFGIIGMESADDPFTERNWHVYHTATNRWYIQSGLPQAGQSLAISSSKNGFSELALSEDNRLVLIKATFEPPRKGLHFLDYAVFGAFLGGLLLIGFLHINARETSDHYFRGGGKVSWLAAGFSIVATRLSATSFVSIPAKSFSSNLQYVLVPFTNFFGAFIMSRYFVRFFMRMKVTSGYEYLERRFSPFIRALGSLNYLCYELARISILILVPAVALSAVAGFDLHITIIVIGLVATIYTAVGGIEGVIWADSFQIMVKVLGLLLASILIFLQLDGTPSDWVSIAMQHGKLKVVDLSWNFTRDTLWVFILFWMTDGLKSYVANQTVIQRFISTKDVTTAKKTIWTSAFVGAGVSWLLLLVGTGLFLFYHQQPERLDLSMDKPDGIFPWFIVTELSPGIVGILLSALTAAAMSSLDGAMNSTVTVVVTDFYKRYYRKASDRGAIRLGRILTGIIGLMATLLALYLSGMASKSLFDQVIRIVGLFGGGLGGLFLLGMLTTRVSSKAAFAGFLISAGVQFYVSNYTSLHIFIYMFTGMTSCFIAGYLASWIFPETRKLDGLTVHTYD